MKGVRPSCRFCPTPVGFAKELCARTSSEQEDCEEHGSASCPPHVD